MKGSLSFKHGNCYEYWCGKHKIRIVPYTQFIFLLNFVDSKDAVISPPYNTTLYDRISKLHAHSINDTFFVSWFGNEQLQINGEIILSFNNERQVSVHGSIDYEAVLSNNTYKSINGKDVKAHHLETIRGLTGEQRNEYIRGFNKNSATVLNDSESDSECNLKD